jgi:serine/threonine-protein kinase HipA
MARQRQLYVFAHLPDPESAQNRFVPAGLLTLNQDEGAAAANSLASTFAYGTRYLDRPGAFELDPVSLSLTDKTGVRGKNLFPANALSEFGGIRDAAPDAWGRRVIEARRKVPANSLSEADYLVEAGGDRVGALDVRASLDSPPSPAASDLHSLEYVLQAVDAIEQGLPLPARLMHLLGAGASAGGARPKASVRDGQAGLWLAKFPSRSDAFDVARAEYCTLELARRCGLSVPEMRVLDIANHPVMLTRRFDRYWSVAGRPLPLETAPHDTRPLPGLQEGRLPFVSGLTLTGCSEFESRLKAYADLAHAMRKWTHSGTLRSNLEELFGRMVLNIFVSNDDDHLRNHGFVRAPRLAGWVLSPLYDVVPRPGIAHARSLHLEVGAQGKLATLDNALSNFIAFTPDRQRALAIMRRVWGEVRQWKTTFEEHGASGVLIDQLQSAFRTLEDICSPTLAKEIRQGTSQHF